MAIDMEQRLEEYAVWLQKMSLMQAEIVRLNIWNCDWNRGSVQAYDFALETFHQHFPQLTYEAKGSVSNQQNGEDDQQ